MKILDSVTEFPYLSDIVRVVENSNQFPTISSKIKELKKSESGLFYFDEDIEKILDHLAGPYEDELNFQLLPCLTKSIYIEGPDACGYIGPAKESSIDYLLIHNNNYMNSSSYNIVDSPFANYLYNDHLSPIALEPKTFLLDKSGLVPLELTEKALENVYETLQNLAIYMAFLEKQKYITFKDYETIKEDIEDSDKFESFSQPSDLLLN